MTIEDPYGVQAALDVFSAACSERGHTPVPYAGPWCHVQDFLDESHDGFRCSTCESIGCAACVVREAIPQCDGQDGMLRRLYARRKSLVRQVRDLDAEIAAVLISGNLEARKTDLEEAIRRAIDEDR
jgi:hypothetical protein